MRPRLLDGRDVTASTPAELARALADAITERPAAELRELSEAMRAASEDATLSPDLRATAAIERVAIDRYLDHGEDPLPALLHMCEVVDRGNREPSFDYLTALFDDTSAR
jgi:hypothetical protein